MVHSQVYILSLRSHTPEALTGRGLGKLPKHNCNKPLSPGWYTLNHTGSDQQKTSHTCAKSLKWAEREGTAEAMGGGVPTLQPVSAGHVTTMKPIASRQWEYCPPFWAESNVCVNTCQLPPALEGNINTTGMPMNWVRRAGKDEEGFGRAYKNSGFQTLPVLEQYLCCCRSHRHQIYCTRNSWCRFRENYGKGMRARSCSSFEKSHFCSPTPTT